MLTIITEIIASVGSPSQLIRPVIRPRRNSVQLMTLKVGSNIHFHAKVDSTVGMMNGSRTKARVSALPLKWRFSHGPRQRPAPRVQNAVPPAVEHGIHAPPRARLLYARAAYSSHPTYPHTPPALAP